jgi:hypothetical protein
MLTPGISPSWGCSIASAWTSWGRKTIVTPPSADSAAVKAVGLRSSPKHKRPTPALDSTLLIYQVTSACARITAELQASSSCPYASVGTPLELRLQGSTPIRQTQPPPLTWWPRHRFDETRAGRPRIPSLTVTPWRMTT